MEISSDPDNLSAQERPDTRRKRGKREMPEFSVILDNWISYIRPNVKESTYSRYVFMCERHLRPDLGAVRINEMDRLFIDTYMRGKLEHGELKHGGPLSPKTVTCIMSVLKEVLAYGRDTGYKCAEGSIVRGPKKQLPEIRVLSAPDRARLETYLSLCYDPACTGVFLSLYAGLRIGEVCGLKWEDVDFEAGVLHVRRTLSRIQNVTHEETERKHRSRLGDDVPRTRVIIADPKSVSSKRDIPLPAGLVAILAKYRAAPEDYVLTGTRLYREPRNYYYWYSQVLMRLGLPAYNYHALRHTFATYCVEHGMDAKSLSEILGHSDITMTLRRYVHPSMEAKRRQMEMIGQGMDQFRLSNELQANLKLSMEKKARRHAHRRRRPGNKKSASLKEAPEKV